MGNSCHSNHRMMILLSDKEVRTKEEEEGKKLDFIIK